MPPLGERQKKAPKVRNFSRLWFGIPVVRVSPQAAHDHAEVFDGVPSQHDGKDAAVVSPR
jgi:hypothetical protein